MTTQITDRIKAFAYGLHKTLGMDRTQVQIITGMSWNEVGGNCFLRASDGGPIPKGTPIAPVGLEPKFLVVSRSDESVVIREAKQITDLKGTADTVTIPTFPLEDSVSIDIGYKTGVISAWPVARKDGGSYRRMLHLGLDPKKQRYFEECIIRRHARGLAVVALGMTQFNLRFCRAVSGNGSVYPYSFDELWSAYCPGNAAAISSLYPKYLGASLGQRFKTLAFASSASWFEDRALRIAVLRMNTGSGVSDAVVNAIDSRAFLPGLRSSLSVLA